MSANNPWDKTIWDPVNPEHAIEDPMHGPSAVHALLQIPAMPLGDGTYYQPGAYYMHGTALENSQGKPVFRIGASIVAGMRELNDLQEWTEASSRGSDALIALEASRQQKRLETKGYAHCYKSTDVCPGGKQLKNCETGKAAYDTAIEWATENDQDKPGDGTFLNRLLGVGGACVACSVSCSATVKTHDGKPQETLVSFYRPHPNLPTFEVKL